MEDVFRVSSLVKRVASHSETTDYQTEIEDRVDLSDAREEILNRVSSVITQVYDVCSINFGILHLSVGYTSGIAPPPQTGLLDTVCLSPIKTLFSRPRSLQIPWKDTHTSGLMTDESSCASSFSMGTCSLQMRSMQLVKMVFKRRHLSSHSSRNRWTDLRPFMMKWRPCRYIYMYACIYLCIR